MPAKRVFSDEQIDVLIGVVRRHLPKFKNQKDMAKALGITQPALSSLLAGKWSPGVTTAQHIAELDRLDLEDLIPDFRAPRSRSGSGPVSDAERPNLEKCLSWHEDESRWGAWSVAAVRAGLYGAEDFGKTEWVTKLDAVEKALERVRKAG